MYFYIVEALRNKTVANNLSRFKDELTKQGIAGEVVTTNPLRQTTELLELGVRKGYTTIVGVGDDTHINELAGLLLGSHIALGVVPMQASDSLTKLIGVDSFKQSLLALRFRKLREVTLGEVVGKGRFLTYAKLKNRLPTLFNIAFENFTLSAQTREIVVANLDPETWRSTPGQLNLMIKGLKQQKGLVGKLFTPKDSAFETHIRVPILKIETRDPFSVTVGETEIAETPAVFRALPKTLRLVVAKREDKELESAKQVKVDSV